MFHFLFRGFMEDDEHVKKVFRQPFLFSVKLFLFWGVTWALITGLLWFFYPTYNLESTAIFDLNLLWKISALIGLSCTLAPVFKWYVNAIVMTNESIIVIDWPKLFERRSTRVDLHNLDEITTERIGLKSFMLNYGHIVINKVNGGESIIVKNISRPTKCARIVESYREYAIDKKNFTEESALKGLLSHVVRRHVGDNGQPEREKKIDRYETTRNPQAEVYEERPVRIKRSARVRQSDDDIEVEKELDDTGGIDIDL